jgi:tetratricopeptide (TPR) repeat protein
MSEDPIERASTSSDPDYLIAVINELVEFLRSLPPADPAYESWLPSLVGLYLRLYDLTREIEAIERAIAIGRQLAEAMRPDDVAYANVRSNLGRALTSWYEDFQDATVLDEAVAVLNEAVDGAAESLEKQSALSNLGSALYARHLATDDIADIKRAAGIFTELVKVTDVAHPMRLVRLRGLGDALRAWLQACEDPSVLTEAAMVHRQLRDELPAADPERARFLMNLAGLLGHVADQPLSLLEECVACGREALVLTPADSMRRPGRMAELAVALGQLGVRMADLSVLDEAVQLLRQAAQELPGDSEARRDALVMLGRYLVNSFHGDHNAARLEAMSLTVS